MAEPIGIKVPIQLGQQGYFNQTFSSLEEAKSNLFNLLLTRKGERPMQPEFGVDIYGQLFNQLTSDVGNHIEQEVRNAVEMWLPYVELTKVAVDMSKENIENNKLDIKIEFGLRRDLKQYDEIIVTFLI